MVSSHTAQNWLRGQVRFERVSSSGPNLHFPWGFRSRIWKGIRRSAPALHWGGSCEKVSALGWVVGPDIRPNTLKCWWESGEMYLFCVVGDYVGQPLPWIERFEAFTEPENKIWRSMMKWCHFWARKRNLRRQREMMPFLSQKAKSDEAEWNDVRLGFEYLTQTTKRWPS